MEQKLIERLESAVTRLESLSSGFIAGGLPGGGGDAASSGVDASSDPSIVAFVDLMTQYVGAISKAAEKIGGQVLQVTMILQEAFAVQKELLIKVKHTQVSDSTAFLISSFFFFWNEFLLFESLIYCCFLGLYMCDEEMLM